MGASNRGKERDSQESATQTQLLLTSGRTWQAAPCLQDITRGDRFALTPPRPHQSALGWGGTSGVQPLACSLEACLNCDSLYQRVGFMSQRVGCSLHCTELGLCSLSHFSVSGPVLTRHWAGTVGFIKNIQLGILSHGSCFDIWHERPRHLNLVTVVFIRAS